MLYTCAFQSLYYQADKIHRGALPVPVRLMMDEFCNVSLPDDFGKLQATMRSRNIMSTIVLQNISALKALFKDDWEGLLGNDLGRPQPQRVPRLPRLQFRQLPAGGPGVDDP